jgi:hypothetical protein
MLEIILLLCRVPSLQLVIGEHVKNTLESHADVSDIVIER